MSSFSGNLGPVMLDWVALSAGGCTGGGLMRNLLGAIVGKVGWVVFLLRFFLGEIKLIIVSCGFCEVWSWIFCACMEVGNLLNCDTALVVNSILGRFPSNLYKFTIRDLLSNFLPVPVYCVFVLFRVFRIGGVDSRESGV